MSNIIDKDGIKIQTRQEIVEFLIFKLKDIYGTGINLDPDSPDRQLIEIISQVAVDNLELIVQVYNSFDPDLAIGKVLDQRANLNGVVRQGGTFSRTNISITTDRALTLFGLNQEDNPVYTVQDSEGNQWQILETEEISEAGIYSLLFQSLEIGEVLASPNTINQPVTIVLGVTDINNPTAQTVIGIDEETDKEVKDRRRRSVALSSQGYLPSLVAALENITGVRRAIVYENDTNDTDGEGVPPHSIWVIVDGNYDDIDVATVIYQKRNAGAGMFGGKEFDIEQIDGSDFTINWDDVEIVELYAGINLGQIDEDELLDYESIKQSIVEGYLPEVFQSVNKGRVSTLVQEADQNAVVIDAGFAAELTDTFEAILSPETRKDKFLFIEDKVGLFPMIIIPETISVNTEQSITFEARGGYNPLVFSIETNNSGASINSSTGEYEAGTTAGTDTIRVTDDDGNFVEATVEVV